MDSLLKDGLVPAQITIISGRDTIKLITFEDEYTSGHVSYWEPLEDTVRITVSFPGYETHHGTVEINQAPGLINIANIFLKRQEGYTGHYGEPDKVRQRQLREGKNRKNRSRNGTQ